MTSSRDAANNPHRRIVAIARVAPVPIPRLRPLLTRKGVVVTAHVENPVPNSIVGHLLQLGEGHQIAIYTRRGAFWVAEFTDGESELLNAGTFFRFHARTLRYSSGCRAVTLEPHVLEKIERLHQRREARDARIWDASLAVMASVMRCCRSLTLLSRSRTAKIAERGT